MTAIENHPPRALFPNVFEENLPVNGAQTHPASDVGTASKIQPLKAQL